jgi:hypothetical protein
VASPERAAGLVEGNRYDTSVAAEVITGKYAYHLPIYREQDYLCPSGKGAILDRGRRACWQCCYSVDGSWAR